jgi:Family of unknown function (DUF6353)
MDLSGLFSKVIKTLKSNSPEILTALSVSGVITTAYFTGKAAYIASEIINDNEKAEGKIEDFKARFKENTKQTWRLYIPAGVSGTLTIVCILGSSRASGRRTAAAVTAYSIGEKAFTEYREKVVEQIGRNKEQTIRDQIAQDSVLKIPKSTEVIITGKGDILCCELYTRRYFRSDMESLRKAQNDINARIVNEFYVVLDEFYDIIKLTYTSQSSRLGWDSDKLMELTFSTVLSETGEPCLAFDYNYLKPLR